MDDASVVSQARGDPVASMVLAAMARPVPLWALNFVRESVFDWVYVEVQVNRPKRHFEKI